MRHHKGILASLAALAMGGILIGSCLAQDAKTTFIDPTQAGIDYQIQGEYAGEAKLADGTPFKGGMQVIALGRGKFRCVGQIGGLPGDGSTGKDTQGHESDGELKDGRMVFKMGESTGTIKDGLLTVRDSNGNEQFSLKKIDRKSPTLGLKPPTGAVVLFDGTSAEQFNGGKMTEDKLLNVGVRTKQALGSFTLHMEFRTPFMPSARGQARGNSGLYLQDRYELQILDSFGLKGLNNECGGFYTQRDPDINMCFPPLAWQTYDIDFQAAQYDAAGNKTKKAVVTVRHNGVVVHESFELPGPTPGGKAEANMPGPLQLQNHGNPVHFRNIWVLVK